ncbi:MAG: hypothetical protein QW683_09040 [Candidatus Caldarchaeum sp.]
MTKVERDYGNGNLQVAYEYGYSSDGAKVWKRDTLSQQEYRYLCRIGCGGVPMRVYKRETTNSRWWLLEEYLQCMGATVYASSFGTFVDMPLTTNNWLFEPGGQSRNEIIVRDTNGSTPRAHVLNFPPPHYLSNADPYFFPQAPKWVLIIVGGIVIAGAITVRCLSVADQTRKEVEQWEDEMHYDHGGGADKLVHCVAACLINLRAGRLCAVLAARSTERGGTPFGPLTGDPLDEKANFDGVDCGDYIKGCGSLIQACVKPPWVTGNDWLDCQSCCRQKGYRGVIKWH